MLKSEERNDDGVAQAVAERRMIMSGGRFDYVDSRLKDEIFGWTDNPSNVFEDYIQ